MEERKTIVNLNEQGCIVQTQKYISDSGQEYTVGLPHNCFYPNSKNGRKDIGEREPSHISAAALAMWGDSYYTPEKSEGAE